MIFVDTSVLVDYLRGNSTPAVEMLASLDANSVPYAIPFLCCQEILQGARDERATLLHDDEDYERIKKVRPGLRTERG